MASFNNIPILNNKNKVIKQSKIKDGVRLETFERCVIDFENSLMKGFYGKLTRDIPFGENTITATVIVTKDESYQTNKIEVSWNHLSPVIPDLDYEMEFSDFHHVDKTPDISDKYNGELSRFLHGLYVFVRDYGRYIGEDIQIQGRADFSTKVRRITTKYMGYKPKLLGLGRVWYSSEGDMRLDRRSSRDTSIKKVVLSFNVPDMQNYLRYVSKNKLSS